MRRQQAGECYPVRWCHIYQCRTGLSPADSAYPPSPPCQGTLPETLCGCGSLVLHRLVPTALSTLIASHSLADTPRPRPVRRREAVLSILQTPYAPLSRPARPFHGAFLAVSTPNPGTSKAGFVRCSFSPPAESHSVTAIHCLPHHTRNFSRQRS